MMRLRWSEDALADLTSIAAYIERERTRNIAAGVINRIHGAIRTLRKYSEQGRLGRHQARVNW
jgi:plasmid stabilization system protein ParE